MHPLNFNQIQTFTTHWKPVSCEIIKGTISSSQDSDKRETNPTIAMAYINNVKWM